MNTQRAAAICGQPAGGDAGCVGRQGMKEGGLTLFILEELKVFTCRGGWRGRMAERIYLFFLINLFLEGSFYAAERQGWWAEG